MSIRPPLPASPRTVHPDDIPKPQPLVDVPKQGDPTVLVNGKPVGASQASQEGGTKAKSGAIKEGAAAKVAEQKLSGQAQEVKLHSLWADTQNDLNVKINGKAAHRKDDQQSDCDGQNNIKEKK